MRLADKIATMARRGSGGVPLNWLVGRSWYVGGTLSNVEGHSATDTFVPVIGGHTITWLYSDRSITSSNRGALIQWGSDKKWLYYTNANQSTGKRTVTIGDNVAYVSWTVSTGFENLTYLYDETDGKYIVKDGILLASA